MVLPTQQLPLGSAGNAQAQEFLDLEIFLQQIINKLPQLLIAILIVVAFWLFSRYTTKPFKIVLRRARLDPHLVRILTDNIYHFALITLGVVMAAAQLGINVSAALAGIGIVGVAVVVIPNKVIVDEVVDNHSKHGEMRIDAIIGIAYKEHIPEARKVLLNAAKSVEGVMDDPPPSVLFRILRIPASISL